MAKKAIKRRAWTAEQVRTLKTMARQKKRASQIAKAAEAFRRRNEAKGIQYGLIARHTGLNNPSCTVGPDRSCARFAGEEALARTAAPDRLRGYALVSLCGRLAHLPVASERSAGIENTHGRAVTLEMIAIASLAGNVCSSASSSSPSRWASALEEALCGLCSIGMKDSFNAFQSILYAGLDETADAHN